ncbi:hypothetical protein HYV87_03740 [Candidatus Woesearchaeota archaeon]|nr:hypothetical protein [Candidatus Woesearchaeota archaeon]MBI2582207.1 hypothetical protein [Candidatus Woesearchaeota archaeon]
MRVFCSGISGAGASSYIAKVVEHAQAKGETIKVFDVGKEVLQAAERYGRPVTSAGILDLSTTSLRYLTGAVYERIAGEIDQYPNCIIDGHINFRWRGTLTTVVTPEMVGPLNPDVYVTVMNLGRSIYTELKDGRDVHNQWKAEVENGNITVANILDWQNMEVKMTEQFAGAGLSRKKMYVLPSQDSPDSLYKIVTRRTTDGKSGVEVAYVSFPITSIKDDEESRQKIYHFVEGLRSFRNLAVVSPKALVLPADPSTIENQHTVMQDLEWFVEKADSRIFVCFPKKVRSRGVEHESIRAKESGKQVWFTAPPEMKDPFTDSAIHYRFYSPEECIEKLVKSGMERD